MSQLPTAPRPVRVPRLSMQNQTGYINQTEGRTSKESAVRINLGCGHLPLEGYINVDQYADEADVKADALTCSFEHVTELVAYHLLEHMSPFDGAVLLNRAVAWMRSGGTLEVEVPDMETILDGWHDYPLWQIYVYGAQEHEGEIHRWGYTKASLVETVQQAGWIVDEAVQFLSEENQRRGMPCLLVRAHRK